MNRCALRLFAVCNNIKNMLVLVALVLHSDSHKPKPEQLSTADRIRQIEGFVELQPKLLSHKAAEEVSFSF